VCSRTAFPRLASSSILTVAAHLGLEVLDLCESRVLAACSEEIAQVAESDTAVAALVEEGEGLLEVCALRLLVHGWLAVCGMGGFAGVFVCGLFLCASVLLGETGGSTEKKSRLRGVVVDKSAGDFGFGSVSRSPLVAHSEEPLQGPIRCTYHSADMNRRGVWKVLLYCVGMGAELEELL
jgi:hypothetical protein